MRGLFDRPLQQSHAARPGAASPARLSYEFDGPDVQLASGELATEDTFITFNGDTTWGGERSRIPFHVTSANWQESDRLLAGLMTAFGSPTRAQPFDGAGEFDGVLTGAFRRPRVEGTCAAARSAHSMSSGATSTAMSSSKTRTPT